MKLKAKFLYAMAATLCVAGAAQAANVPVTTNIATSTTWTANNVYNLVGQIYVLPGATLTIEAGTVIKSIPTDQGSLAICRGAKIFANGTATKPIIFTSTNDTNLITNRSAVNEWGNVTIMGKGYISASHTNAIGNATIGFTDNPSPFHPNTGSPDGLNKAQMEGLTAAGPGDPNVLYGGNDDNDDSGSMSFVSLRFGGIVLGLGNELNGLSLGGVGRETDIHHIDIFDDVDDGVEIWGGTVNLKYLSIWNVGDDSFDCDQGWRGKAQFGLLVQGYGANAKQGSGAGDNIFEIDGAERNDAQPVTTCCIYNFTCIGQAGSAGGDIGLALRDEARVQIRNSIFMNVGECLVKTEFSETSTPNDTTAWGYGTFGTLPYNSVWTSAYSEAFNKANVLTGGHPNVGGVADVLPYNTAFLQNLYKAQSSGNLLELSDNVFFSNINAAAGKEAYANTTGGYTQVSALVGSNNHDNVVDTIPSTITLPIRSITRGAAATLTDTTMLLVTALDPRANPGSAAETSVGTAPADGFFTPAKFRGAFSKDVNWAKGWTAASAFGLMPVADTATSPVATGATLVTIVSFPTVTGVVYTVESSSDGKNWAPVGTIIGDGNTKAISDVTTVDPTKAYRAIAQ